MNDRISRIVSGAFFCLCAGIAGGQDTNVNNLSPAQLSRLSLEDLMQMEVTSVSKSPEPIANAPAAIQVITSDDIHRMGSTTIPEALRLADNLDVAQVNSHDWAISARGFNGTAANKLLVLMDGRTLYTPLFSGVFWDVQNYLMEDIDRIEVISGPAGTLWGANAVNGVINITSKSARDTQGFYLEAGGGNDLQDFSGFHYGLTLASNVYLRVYGKYETREAEVFSNGQSADDAWGFGQGGFRMDWLPTTANTITFQGDYYNGREGQFVGPDTSVSGGNLLGRFSHSFSQDSDLTLQMYYDQTHRRIPGTYEEDLGTTDVDFQYHLRIGERNDVVAGLGYRFMDDRVVNSPGLAFLPAHFYQDIYSGFVQDEIKLLEDLRLTLGSKVEHNHYSGWEEEPSGRLAYSVSRNQLLWAAISRAVRTPSRIDEDLFAPANPPYLIAGSRSFISETLLAYELGYRAQVMPKLGVSATAFYNEYDHVRSLSPGPPISIGNNLGGQTYGIEVSGTYQLASWWRLHAGYDLLKEHIRSAPGTADFSGSIGETSDPQQQFSIRSSMDLPHHITVDLRLRYEDPLHNNSGGVTGTVPSYFELDGQVAWHVCPNVELAIVGQNLLHDHHPEFGFPSALRTEIERSVFGKVSWRF